MITRSHQSICQQHPPYSHPQVTLIYYKGPDQWKGNLRVTVVGQLTYWFRVYFVLRLFTCVQAIFSMIWCPGHVGVEVHKRNKNLWFVLFPKMAHRDISWLIMIIKRYRQQVEELLHGNNVSEWPAKYNQTQRHFQQHIKYIYSVGI